MKIRKLLSIPFALVTAAGVLACGSGDGEGADEAAADTEAAQAAAETPDNPRFGVWQLESDRAPPYRNVMTYEPWGDGGMKITVATTNAEGETSSWGYTTMFDGEFSPVEGGGEGATTAVEVVDDRTNRILNARDGEVYQVIVNVLSEDGNTINNEYRRTREDGTESVSHAVYRRIE